MIVGWLFTYVFSWVMSLIYAPVVLIGLFIPKSLYIDTSYGRSLKGLTAWTFMYIYGASFPSWI